MLFRSRFLCFLREKRARERELDLFPLQKIASSDVILARTICVPRIYRCVRVQFRAAGTGHEKRRAFRESSIYIETCILQTPRMDNFLNPILYVTRPLFFCNFLNEPVWKRLLDRLRKCHEDCARYSFKMQLPYGNY